MDENTNLIIANGVKAEDWEDTEKATDDVVVLREEFRKRLYPQQTGQAGAQNSQSKARDN
jgi:hypothetical protein